MPPSIRVTSSGKGKGVGIVIPTLAATHDTLVAIDVENDLRRGSERD